MTRLSPWTTDPFGPATDPHRYVPRTATERALGFLELWLRGEPGSALLVGPAGIGKTLLLRVLEQRLRPELPMVHVPHPTLPAEGICRWALDALGDRACSDPEVELAARLAREGEPLVLAIDDAHALPPATARRLAALRDACEGRLRLLAVSNDLESDSPLLRALGFGASIASLSEPMTEEETGAYVRARLAECWLPAAVHDCFDADALSRLHGESLGNPARLHAAAVRLLIRQVPAELGVVSPAPRIPPR